MFCNMLREVRLKCLVINMNINCRSYWLYNMYINRWFALAENFPMKNVRSRINVNFDFTLFMYLQKKLMYCKKQDIFYTKDVILRYNRWKTLYFFFYYRLSVSMLIAYRAKSVIFFSRKKLIQNSLEPKLRPLYVDFA